MTTTQASLPRTAALAAHRYAMPVVRELGAPAVRRQPSQRALVVASLLRCDREPRSARQRPA